MMKELTPEQRQEILDQIHQREFLEREALTQEKAARQAESERQHRESLAEAARQAEEERQQRLVDSLKQVIKLSQEALEVLQEGNESQAYYLLVKADPAFIAVKQQINRPPKRSAAGTIPVIKVKADNPLGFAFINCEDLTPVHEVLEDAE